jgi:hypothetical protein
MNEFLMDKYELEWLTIQPFGGPAMENLSNTKTYITNGNKTYILAFGSSSCLEPTKDKQVP